MNDRVGQELGNYRLLRLLGHGGFAEVYLAEHRYLKRKAAMKILAGKMTEDDMDGFLREAQTIAALKHPHILPVFDFGMDAATPFLVMEYAANGTLRGRHKRGVQVPLSTVVEYVKQIADALQYAHDTRVIHRDIKPENMLLDERDTLLLSDFGIAAVAHSTSSMRTIDSSGTPHYMSPEQFQGKPMVASDQYALAVVVYEWLCGQRPYTGDSFYSIGMQHFSSPIPALRVHNSGLPPEIETVMQIALAKDPKDRFANIQAFARALEQASLPPTASTSRPTNAQIAPTVIARPGSALPPTIYAQSPAIVTPLPSNAQIKTPALSTSASSHTPITARQPLGTTLLTYSDHVGPIYTVAWSPDGLRVASAGNDDAVHIWSAQTGKRLFIYRGKAMRANVVAWSPDGMRLAVAWSPDKDGTALNVVQIWDIQTNSLNFTYTEHSSRISAITWSPDGTRIASAGNDDAVHIWSVQTGKRLFIYRGKAIRAGVVTWSPDGMRLAVAWSPDKSGLTDIVQIWDVQTNSLSITYKGHFDRISALAWSPDSMRLASAGADRTVQVWEVQTGKNSFTHRDYDLISSVVWSPDGGRLAFPGHYRAVQVLDVNTGNSQFTYKGHSDNILSVAWSPDGSRIVSAGQDKTALVWQTI